MEKNKDKISAMVEAGRIIGRVKGELRKFVKPGMSLAKIDNRARELIEAAGAETNFDLEPGYKWATCVNVNTGIVHGIPHPDVYLVEGDLLKIDTGCKLRGWNVDTAMCMVVGEDMEKRGQLVERGYRILERAIETARAGKTIYDISLAMERGIMKYGYDPVFQLVGHGIGREMHEDPQIPCIAQKNDRRFRLEAGAGLAIEVMFAEGDAFLKLADDGWTYETKDGSMSVLVEETMIVQESGAPLVVTREIAD